MNIVALVTKSYSYTESIAAQNADRAEAGEPPMTHQEIEEYIREDIYNDGGDGYNAAIIIEP